MVTLSTLKLPDSTLNRKTCSPEVSEIPETSVFKNVDQPPVVGKSIIPETSTPSISILPVPPKPVSAAVEKAKS